MQQVFHALQQWMAERNISTKSLTVILNFSDPSAAAHFDAEFRRSLENITDQPVRTMDIREFEMMGVKARIESPLHAEPGNYVIKPQRD